MQRIEEMSDADVAEVWESAKLFRGVEEATADLRGLLDFLCGLRWLTAGMKRLDRMDRQGLVSETLGRQPAIAFKLLSWGPTPPTRKCPPPTRQTILLLLAVPPPLPVIRTLLLVIPPKVGTHPLQTPQPPPRLHSTTCGTTPGPSPAAKAFCTGKPPFRACGAGGRTNVRRADSMP